MTTASNAVGENKQAAVMNIFPIILIILNSRKGRGAGEIAVRIP